MAEPFSTAAGVIAVIQITDRVISLCKFYIQTARDAPRDLRTMLIEISALKMVLDNVKFLCECDEELSAALALEEQDGGPVKGCRQALEELESFFPPSDVDSQISTQRKWNRPGASLHALKWPLKASKAKSLLEEIARYKSTITFAIITSSAQDLKDIKQTARQIQNVLTEKQRRDIYACLEYTDPSPLHHRAQESYEPGTCEWFPQYPDWTKWLVGTCHCLWLHGIPGAGKTVLISYFIDRTTKHIQAQVHPKRLALAYYYCYFGHKQCEASPFLKWILNRLCRQADYIPPSVQLMYSYGGEPSLADLLTGIQDILSEFEKVFIILDAIDESEQRSKLLKVLRDLSTDTRFAKIQLLTSSREYVDIEEVMGGCSTPVSMANPYVERDIHTCVMSLLHNNRKFQRCPPDLLDEIGVAISQGARGM